MIAFIDAHRDRFGVEPICRVLREHDCGIAPNTYWAAKKRPPSARAERDAELVVEIHRAMGDAVGNVPVASWSRYLLAESLFAGRDPGACSSDTADVAKVAPMNRHEIVAYALAQLDTN